MHQPIAHVIILAALALGIRWHNREAQRAFMNGYAHGRVDASRA